MAEHDDETRLPIKFGPVSNGEFAPRPPSPLVREAIRRTHRTATENARRLGISRRRFLSTLSGAAVAFVALNACSSEQKGSAGGGSPGGSFDVSSESTLDSDAAIEDLMGEEFIMDVQTHFIDADLATPLGADGRFFGDLFPQASCERGQEIGDGRICFSIESFLEEMFIRSDTSLAVLSALPIPGDSSPMSWEAMDRARKIVTSLCPEERVLMHGGAFPHVGSLDIALEAMTTAVNEHDIAAWKIYTMVPVEGAFYFDDHDPDRPRIGQMFIDHVREIGPPIICTHKGFKDIVSSNFELSSPVDIGPAAARNPDITFVVYHSGFEPTHVEGPWDPDPAEPHGGIDRLIASVLGAGIEPNSNVYAELGGTWWFSMQDPEMGAHVLGKLLKYIGEDRVLWGTDSIWFGTPQDQIQALRTFRISEEFQERYGYPALTDEIKAKIFGISSARLYGVDVEGVSCDFTRAQLQTARQELALPRAYGPDNNAEFIRMARAYGTLG